MTDMNANRLSKIKIDYIRIWAIIITSRTVTEAANLTTDDSIFFQNVLGTLIPHQ